MLKHFIGCVIALVFCSMPNWLAAQIWGLNEVYSNADRSVQFVVHSTAESGQQHLGGRTLVAAGEGTTHTFTFPHDLPCDSEGHSFLIATQGFADLNLVQPDYVVPNGFFPLWTGVIWVADHGYGYAQVPTDGTQAFWLDPDFVYWYGTAVATNFAGQRYAFGPYFWPPPTPASLVNGSFEIPELGSGFQYIPGATGIGWTFCAGSGIQGNGSAWGAATAPNGTQTAFIQGTGSMAQTITLNAGSYTLSF